MSVQAVKPLSSGDLIAFNEQFAQLAAAGLPVEHGLRLIAQDLQRGRLADSIRSLASELEKGVPLPEAFYRHANQFPPLYGRLVDAGIRSNNLAGLLLNLGRHLETMRRLRAALWRATAYPAMVIILLGIVLLFIGHVILPQFQNMYGEFSKYRSPGGWNFVTGTYNSPVDPPELPLVTKSLYVIAEIFPIIFAACFLCIALGPWLLKRLSYDHRGVEAFTWKLPLIGPILKRSLLARWCDAAALAVSTGMDLPGAIRLASDAIHSPSLTLDGTNLAEHVESGKAIDTPTEYAALPATVPAAMQLATRVDAMAPTLRSLAELYEQQCRSRVDNVPAILSPILLLMMAGMIGFVIIALILPLVHYIHYASGIL